MTHSNITNDCGISYCLSFVVQHPQYSESSGGFPNDIAILRLSSSASLDAYVKVAALPTSTSTSFYNGRNCYITGWGRLSGGTKQTKH